MNKCYFLPTKLKAAWEKPISKKYFKKEKERKEIVAIMCY